MKLLTNKFTLILLAIFALSLILRLVLLGSYPVGFHIDEASLGYNGYSMLLTGKDEVGKTLPLYIDMFGDFRPSGYHIMTILPIAVFGLTEFATRFPAALFGGLSVFSIFFLSYVLTQDKRVAALSAFLLAITPWNFVLSRASGEAIIAIFFIMLGFAFIILSFRTGKIYYLLLGSIIVSLSFFFYHTPRVFVPLLYLSLLLMMFGVLKKYSNKFKVFLVSSFLSVSFLAIFLVFGVSGGTGRFTQVNILKSFETDFQLQQSIIQDSMGGVPRILSRPVHNKLTNVGYMFISNYVEYFSGSFLFTKGGLPNWYSIPKVGILHILALPFIIYGIYSLIRTKGIYSKIPLLWLLIGPVVAAITLDDIPNINRASVMFPMWEIVTAYGVVMFILNIPKRYKKPAILILSFLLFLSMYHLLFHYFINAKYFKPWYRNNGFKEMMQIVNGKYDEVDNILLTKHQGGVYPIVLFYSKYDPKKYQMEGSPKTHDYKMLGKIMFVPQDCPFSQYDERFPEVKKRLYIEDGNCPETKRLKLYKYKYILREDGSKAFRIVYDQVSQ